MEKCPKCGIEFESFTAFKKSVDANPDSDRCHECGSPQHQEPKFPSPHPDADGEGPEMPMPISDTIVGQFRYVYKNKAGFDEPGLDHIRFEDLWPPVQADIIKGRKSASLSQELAGYRQQLFSVRDELAICRDERDRYAKELRFFMQIEDGEYDAESCVKTALKRFRAALTQDKEQER